METLSRCGGCDYPFGRETYNAAVIEDHAHGDYVELSVTLGCLVGKTCKFVSCQFRPNL